MFSGNKLANPGKVLMDSLFVFGDELDITVAM